MATLMFGIKRTDIDYNSYLMNEKSRKLFNVYFTDETDMYENIDGAKIYQDYPSALKALQTMKYMGRKISEYCKVCEIVVDHTEYIQNKTGE